MAIYKDKFESLGYDVDVIDCTNEIKINYEKYEVLLIYDAFKKIDVTKMKNLKLIVLSSIGIDQVPLEVFKDDDILITHNHGGYSEAIGEWIVMTLLMGFKLVPNIYKDNLNRTWHMRTNLKDLKGKRILFLGAGTLAVEASRRLKPFKVQTVAISRSAKPSSEFDFIKSNSEIEGELAKADAVVACLPKTASTENFLNRARLCCMKDDAVLINVSRGSVIDETALLELLDLGKFLFVALDVFKNEPLNSDSRFYDFDRVFVSSHNSWISEDRDERRCDYFYSVLESYAKGEKPINLVDKKRGY